MFLLLHNNEITHACIILILTLQRLIICDYYYDASRCVSVLHSIILFYYSDACRRIQMLHLFCVVNVIEWQINV